LIEHNLLGNVAHRAAHGETLAWNPETMTCSGNGSQMANELLGKRYRAGWSPV
jgi:20S proteasome alpha/beta subunit